MEPTFPPPYKKGYFKTTDGYELYYELYGNPRGKPVIFLHGGPGAGFDEQDKKHFDPTIWNVLFFDQRGAGKSKPFASLENNTTDKLVEDIQKLMDMAGFTKALLFGGSWGSTLSLCFAIAHPEKVSGMIIRGIFLATKEEDAHYIGGGAGKYYPEAWERFLSIVPAEKHPNPIQYYYEKIQHGSTKEKEIYAYEFAKYELSIFKMRWSEKQVIKALSEDVSWKTLGPVEIHYIANKCFLLENYIPNNVDKIQNIPVSIIHGRFDMICQPIAAWKLHKALPKSRLFFTLAGHSSSEKPTSRRLAQELKYFATYH